MSGCSVPDCLAIMLHTAALSKQRLHCKAQLLDLEHLDRCMAAVFQIACLAHTTAISKQQLHNEAQLLALEDSNQCVVAATLQVAWHACRTQQ